MVLTNLEYRCMSKSELAILAQVSGSTLQNWMNRRYYDDLKKLGYHKNQKILLPPQVKFLFERLVIVEC